MERIKGLKKYLSLIGTGVLFVFVLAVWIFFPSYSNTVTSNAWDGTISDSFAGGNGSAENPYLISSGSDLAYLKKLLEEDETSFYGEKSYILTTDINLGNHEFSINNLVPFSGIIDGDAYTIYNGNIISSLFSSFENATVKNINFQNTIIKNSEDNVSALLASTSINSTLENITVSSTKEIIYNNFVGALIGIDKGSSLKNIIIDVAYEGDYDTTQIGSILYDGTDTKVENILVKSNEEITYFINDNNITFSNIFTYNVSGSEIIINDNDIEGVISSFLVSDDYKFQIKNESIVFSKIVTLQEANSASTNYLPSLSSVFEIHSSGIAGNILYINDLEADWNYYYGLNYTTATNGTLPSGENQNLYNESNLVRVQLTYSATDPIGNLTGTVSLTEPQSKYVYYKYYPVVNNKIQIELIDNPFVNRPIDKAFNNWVVDGPGQISVDYTSYKRYVELDVNYTDGIPNDIVVDLHASWVEAKVYNITAVNWANVFAGLNAKTMMQITTTQRDYSGFPPYDMGSQTTQYFYQVTILRNASQAGYYNAAGTVQTGTCATIPSCTLYQLILPGDYYSDTNTYYRRSNGGSTGAISSIANGDIPRPYNLVAQPQYDGKSMAGYYVPVTIANGSSRNGYYNASGAVQSGNCTTSGGCALYQLLQSTISSIHDASANYYYMVTRDTNIAVMRINHTTAWTTANQNSKPFTLTMVYNGVDYRNSYAWTVSGINIQVYADTVIEYLRTTNTVNTNGSSPTSNTQASYVYGNHLNLKIGRGMMGTGNRTFGGVFGGGSSNFGSTTAYNRYSLIVESGNYNNIVITEGSSTAYINQAAAISGNDYDRITRVNTNLDVSYAAYGVTGGTINSQTSSTKAIFHNVKSGRFGGSLTDAYTGIYTGGRGGTLNMESTIKVDGGWINLINGGPGSGTNRRNINHIFINVTGGEVGNIYGGAGSSDAQGNRILNITGGKINYSVFGGSNSYSGSTGYMAGSSLVYVGGNVQVGDEALVANNTNSQFNNEAGSVFGIGNGASGQSLNGTMLNSNVIIDGDALILRNVYGGGNRAILGTVTTANGGTATPVTKVDIKGGTIKGDVYGGSNQGNTGTTSITGMNATLNVKVSSGNVKGSVYGGSNISGIVYGSANVYINGGLIENSVYGGGRGGGTSGTFIRNNINVVIGDNEVASTPTIVKNVYGGSALGTVNGTTATAGTAGATTTVTVNKGIVQNSVFGGAQGSATVTPYVHGNVTVNINDGNIGEVFGANDAAGSPAGSLGVYLNGGIVGNVYGGGNQAPANNPRVFLQGSTTTNIFGGSNTSGTVNSSTVTVTSGKAKYVFGGNNVGGVCNTATVNINGGEVTEEVYGGGNLATTGISNLYLNNLSNELPHAYGGGKSANVTTTNVYKNNVTVTNLFGGSNTNGTVLKSNLYYYSGDATNVFGGNNEGGETIDSDITVTTGNIGNLYGGGNRTRSTSCEIIINNGTLGSVFGGGNEFGIDDTTVTINGGTYGTVYGGANKSGKVINTTITVGNSSTTIDKIYGGNNEGGTTDNPKVIVNSGTIGTIYGGGNNAAVNVNTILTLTGGTITGDVFGGGNDGEVGSLSLGGNTTVSISNVVIGGNVYGGGNNADVAKSANLTLTGGTITGDVFGGGNNGAVGISSLEGNTTVSISNVAISGTVYGGGNNAGVSKNTSLTVSGGTITGNVFGGGNYGIVGTDATVKIVDVSVGGSIHAGGNGQTAIVHGNTNISIGGNTVIGDESSIAPRFGSVFGGGNAAATGEQSNNTSVATVNIAGGRVYGNVYGGANTSVVYGTAKVNLGIDTISDSTLKKGDIYIKGTVFGGGEANASGSEIFDYNFISVTDGIDVNINGNGYDHFYMTGSIFGSGNASSTSGRSTINIKNYGTIYDPQKNISVQRTDVLTIDNSSLTLSGATDRTNEYSDVLYSLSIIGNIKLQNNSNLFLENGANLLRKWESLTSDGSYERVVIGEDGSITKNVDNRVYIYEGRNINIATDQSVTSYGEVLGMAFFGMYTNGRDGIPNMGIYDPKYSNGSDLDWGEMPAKGSYILGLHKENHDIQIDGFYSHFMDEDTSTNVIEYIQPEPEDSNYYMWSIGETVIEYTVDLVASKYGTLGTAELTLLGFSKPNTTYHVIGFDAGDLSSTISLVDGSTIPRVAESTSIANSVMGLSMKSSNSGWLNKGETRFLTTDPNYTGTTAYIGENKTDIPSLLFYLYHSKNLTEEGTLGTVRINLMAITKIDALTYESVRLIINVNLSTAVYQTNEYEGTMTPGREYSMFSSTVTNITSKSSFSTYYSLFASGEKIYKDGYHRALVSSYVLPINTKITMIDLVTGKYYYHVLDEDDVSRALDEYAIHREASYRLSMFTQMGSVSSNTAYDDEVMNRIYYSDSNMITDEAFIFIVDFDGAAITSDLLERSLLIELRDENEQTIVSVLGIQQQSLVYNVYADRDAYIEVNATIDENTIYAGHKTDLHTNINFINSRVGGSPIFDTSFFDSKLGIKVTLIDGDGQVVSGTTLLGVSFILDGVRYYPNLDGSIRIKLADRVGNVATMMTLDLSNTTLPTGNYRLQIESFSSPDGIYYGQTATGTAFIPIHIINDIYGLDSKISEYSVIFNAETGTNQNEQNKLDFNLKYNSGLENPSIHITLSRREYNTAYDTKYELVDLKDFIDDNLTMVTDEYEYLLISRPDEINEFSFTMKQVLRTGTYRLDFSLYDDDVFIGKISRYIIIK